jgi:hypothetical protein
MFEWSGGIFGCRREYVLPTTCYFASIGSLILPWKIPSWWKYATIPWDLMNLVVYLLQVESFILNNKKLLKNITPRKYNFLYVSKIEFNNFLKHALDHDFQVHYIHAILELQFLDILIIYFLATLIII